jgi:hypothetical protein
MVLFPPRIAVADGDQNQTCYVIFTSTNSISIYSHDFFQYLLTNPAGYGKITSIKQVAALAEKVSLHRVP